MAHVAPRACASAPHGAMASASASTSTETATRARMRASAATTTRERFKSAAHRRVSGSRTIPSRHAVKSARTRAQATEDVFRMIAEQIPSDYDATFDVAVAAFVSVACVSACVGLWENVWKRAVFVEDEDEGEGGLNVDGARGGRVRVLHGVDVRRYAIFSEPEVGRAVAFAGRWHAGQKRKNGDSYMRHCVESAKILAANLPGTGSKSRDAVCACVLHDILDDTECTDEELREEFGDKVYNLVSQVSRVGQMNEVIRRRRRGMDDTDIKAKLSEEDLMQLRKLLLLIVRDPRVFLIKIADRLHNMRTLYAVNKKEKAIVIANETLQVWCSLAEKLGMWAIKSELEDLCFAVMDPKSFDAIKAARETTWTTSSKDKNSGVDQSSMDVNELFGVDTLPLFNSLKSKAKEIVASGSVDDEASQLTDWQLDMKKRIETVPSFDWLSTRDGESFDLDGIDELPSSVSSSLSTLDKIRSRLWQDLLIDGFGTDVKISISSRLKSAYSTHLKMKRKSVDFSQIYDARAMRIVVGETSSSESGTSKEIDTCYQLLDLVHKLYRPIEGEYDDYITNAKPTGYRSLHTAVGGPDGAPLEVQVRTRAMHDAAEFGIAAQWMYKGKKKFASKSYQSAMQTESVPEVGSPVQLVSGGRRSCGVVVKTMGSRILIAEPMRSEWKDVATWMENNQHHILMDIVKESGLTQARQGTSEFFISEFCFCVDQRWHRVDNLGHKTRVTAEIVDTLIEDEDTSWEEDDMDDIDIRIRRLQSVAGDLLNENDSDGVDETDTVLSNWSVAAAEIQERKRITDAKKSEEEKEARWRSGETEAPSLGILLAQGGSNVIKPKGGGQFFAPVEGAKFEAELGLRRPNSKTPNIDVSEGVMIVTWTDDAPEVRSVKRGVTAADLKKLIDQTKVPSDDDPVEADEAINVNMVMVPPNTPLKDGDMIFLNETSSTAREIVRRTRT